VTNLLIFQMEMIHEKFVHKTTRDRTILFQVQYNYTASTIDLNCIHWQLQRKLFL